MTLSYKVVANSIWYITFSLGVLATFSYGGIVLIVYFGWDHSGEILSFLIQIFAFTTIFGMIINAHKEYHFGKLPDLINKSFFKEQLETKTNDPKVQDKNQKNDPKVEKMNESNNPKLKKMSEVNDPKVQEIKISRDAFYLILALVFLLISPFIIMFMWKWVMHK